MKKKPQKKRTISDLTFVPHTGTQKPVLVNNNDLIVYRCASNDDSSKLITHIPAFADEVQWDNSKATIGRIIEYAVAYRC